MAKNWVRVTHRCMRWLSSTQTGPTFVGLWSTKPRAMTNSAIVWPGSMEKANTPELAALSLRSDHVRCHATWTASSGADFCGERARVTGAGRLRAEWRSEQKPRPRTPLHLLWTSLQCPLISKSSLWSLYASCLANSSFGSSATGPKTRLQPTSPGRISTLWVITNGAAPWRVPTAPQPPDRGLLSVPVRLLLEYSSNNRNPRNCG